MFNKKDIGKFETICVFKKPFNFKVINVKTGIKTIEIIKD